MALTKSFAIDREAVADIGEQFTEAMDKAVDIGEIMGEAIRAVGATKASVVEKSGVTMSRLAQILSGDKATVEEATGLCLWVLDNFDEDGDPIVASRSRSKAKMKKTKRKLESVPEPDDDDDDWDDED